MIAAYFDESSDNSQQKVFAAGGFVGRNEHWLMLEWKWKDLLQEYKLEYYRATECEHARGRFDKPPFRTERNRLTLKQREMLAEVRSRFLNLAIESDVTGMVVAMDMKDFHAVANTPAILDKFGKTPYYLTYHLAMAKAVECAREQNVSDPIAFVCDSHEQFSHHMLEVHSDFWKTYSSYDKQVGSLTYEDKRNFIGLQVADSLVYEVRRDLEAEMDSRDAPEREELTKLKQAHAIYRIDLCQRPCLEEFLSAHMIDAPRLAQADLS